MRDSGDYNTPFTWEVMTRASASDTGNQARVYNANGTIWGLLDLDSSTEVNEFGAGRTMVRGTAYLRQWPGVKGEDRLVDTQFNMTYLVVGVRLDRANNETVVDLESYEAYP